jgi:hypothetical protein
MRTHHFFIIAGLAAALAAPAGAQTIKKVGDDVHHVLKKAGTTVKEDAGEVGSATHHVLQKAGNGTKTALGNATGIHKVGGTVGTAAQDVSHASKTIGRSSKATVKKGASVAHNKLTRAGNKAKAEVKPEL